MNCCFPCCASKKSYSKREHGSTHQETTVMGKTPEMNKQMGEENHHQGEMANIEAQTFTFRELATATKNFRQECLMGEGGFGRVYKGIIPATGQAVAVKQLDRNGMQGKEEFLAEVLTLNQLHHENLVNLIGYCADGDQRLLVFEFYPGCTLEDRLLENKTDQPPLNWYDRMKVASGTSKGLEYLHERANPPVIYRDLKGTNVLLDNDLNVKLCDFGMAKLSGGDKMTNGPPRIVGTYGYCAPEYVRTGHFTMKSDVYSFGVILLELITGRRAVDTTRPNEEQNLVSWAQPLFRDPKRYPEMADPLLNRTFPEKDLNQAVAIAAMCLQEEAEARPLISDVVTALSFLSTVPPEGIPPSLPATTSAISRKSAVSASEYETESEIVSESEAESAKGSLRRRNTSYYDSESRSSRRHVSASTKYRDSDVSDMEDSRRSSSRSSRRSSTRSRKAAQSSDSADGSVSSSSKGSRKSHKLSQKSTKKSDASAIDLSQKSSKKSSAKDLSQKSSRKSSIRERDLSHKTSRKSSVRISSHKSSMMGSEDGSVSSSRRSSSVASEDGGVLYKRSSMRLSQGNISFGLISSGSVHSEESIQLDHTSSMGSDEGSGHPFDHSSSSGSYKGSVH